VEGKTQGRSARSLSGRQPEDKKPSVKGTPLMETPKVPNLTMIHADLLHYQPTQGSGNFVYKNFAGVSDTQVEPKLSSSNLHLVMHLHGT
jgi:hypothetical protein